MPLRISPSFFDALAQAGGLDSAQIVCIARIAYLAAHIDFEEVAADNATLDEVGALLWRLIDEPARAIPPVSPLPLDDEECRARIDELANGLTTSGARELAFALAYVLAISDIQLATAEARFLADLQRALSIDDQRASELAEAAARAVTPGLDGAA